MRSYELWCIRNESSITLGKYGFKIVVTDDNENLVTEHVLFENIQYVSEIKSSGIFAMFTIFCKTINNHKTTSMFDIKRVDTVEIYELYHRIKSAAPLDGGSKDIMIGL